MVRRGLKTTVIATVMAMMLAPSFSAFAQTGKSNTSGSWQVENNAWVFRNAEGQSVKGWVVYNQEWYYLNPENGQLKTGWLQLDGKWYFLSTESGAQQGRLLTGWQWIDGYCYYLMPTDDSNYGVLVVNGRTPDGYYVNQSGQWLHGENGDVVYEAGKGLPSAASSQQVAGASRALPGQVLGASRAIAAPGGGSFGGGGGGGSTGGGATASTTGGAGTATTGTATTGTATTGTSTAGGATAGASTETSTGGSAAGTTGTAGESVTVGEGAGASTGTETGGNTTEKPVETVTPGTSENTTQPGGTTENSGTETGGTTTEKPGESETPGNSENPTQPGGITENPGTENGGNTTEKPVESENSGNSENTTQPGGTTENSGTETGGNTTEKPVETENPGTSENTTKPGGTTENPGTENGGATTEKPGETVTPGTSENTTQPGGTTEKSGTENGGTTTEKPGETETPGNSENTTQPGGTTEEKPKPVETENPGTSENTTQPEKPVENSNNGVEKLQDWPAKYELKYNTEKKYFVLSLDEGDKKQELKNFLWKTYKTVSVNGTEYEEGDARFDLLKEVNTYCLDLIGEEKGKDYLNAFSFSKSAFHEGDNVVEIRPEGYKPVTIHINVTKEELQDGKVSLQKPDELKHEVLDKVNPGKYNVKLVLFRNLSDNQREYLLNLNEVVVDNIRYKKVEPAYFEDLAMKGNPVFFTSEEEKDVALNLSYYPKEAGEHKVALRKDGYEDLVFSYTQAQAKSAPVMNKLEKKEAQGYYELSFQGDRKSVQNYLKSIKTLTVAGRTYGQMAAFNADLLKMGEKFSFGDSKGEKELEDLLLFSVPTANADKKQEIQIEAEGYEVNTILLP